MVADKTLVSSLASLLDTPLPPQVALATLTSTSFNPGARPLIFDDGAESQVRQHNTCCLHVHAQSTDTRDPCADQQRGAARVTRCHAHESLLVQLYSS